MKRLIVIMLISCCGTVALWAQNKPKEPFSPEEFRAKQEAYLTEKAKLTKEEAAKFFPLYNELQDRKGDLNRKAWQLIKRGDDDKKTEAEYEQIIGDVLDSRINCDQLEKEYFFKFKRIISCEKIYNIQKAEMHFHRELLKGMKEKDKSHKK